MDREKVIKGLECHKIDGNHRINCSDCPYYADDGSYIRCVNNLHDDALALLKEQETVKPKTKTRHGAYPQISHRCGNCGEVLYRYYNYCPSCGKVVKWE